MHNFYKAIEKSKDIISGAIETYEKTSNPILTYNSCDDVLPLEYFMQIPNRMKIHKFYQDIKVGDVVIGRVTHIYHNRIEANLICSMCALTRDIDDLKITAICRTSDLPIVSNFSSIKAFRCGDKIKAIITKIARHENLEISMNEMSSMNRLRQTDLGLISDENLPSYFKILSGSSANLKYLNDVLPSNELSSSIDIQTRMEYFNINCGGFSLLDDINRIQISPTETAKSMRSALLAKESMKFVVKGVNYYKMKRLNEALQCYNHALKINESNVDALVARGALRASVKTFELSIEDLEQAVKIDPNHKNAALYLSQTIIAYSKSLPESDRTTAETLVKNTIMSKDDLANKTVSNDIKDHNKFIVITDEESDESSHSSNSHRKSKNKGMKKRKSKIPKKHIVIHSSSSESRHRRKRCTTSIDSSGDCSIINDKSMRSSFESTKRSRQHSKDSSNDKHKKMKLQSLSSSSSDSNSKKPKGTSKQSDRESRAKESSPDLPAWRSFKPPHELTLRHHINRYDSFRNKDTNLLPSTRPLFSDKFVGTTRSFLKSSNDYSGKSYATNTRSGQQWQHDKYDCTEQRLSENGQRDTTQSDVDTIVCNRTQNTSQADRNIKEIEEFIQSMKRSVPL